MEALSLKQGAAKGIMHSGKTGIHCDFRPAAIWSLPRIVSKLLRVLEARAGIEPAHKGFADLSLTTWVPRLGRAALQN
jgi:hypothetical protein